MYKDRWIQKFRKEEDGWKEYSRNGTVRPCTAEQFISHLLPPLAGIKGQYITAKVVPDKKDEDKKARKTSPNEPAKNATT
jgi:hypothetical protein